MADQENPGAKGKHKKASHQEEFVTEMLMFLALIYCYQHRN